ncbi:3-deoxy-7-phosphoheptulonate synthase [Candidatus Peregrinibacteria bacterium RIFOXYB2_FULL_32_7]|nr:MAG: 3-deoxy-7-phosphoheptulonate synthase [Candidatus Peregrinibacteria bacterium RIFOXYB2_FULL_32_7]
MIIVMKRFASKQSIQHMIDYIESVKLTPAPLYGTERTVIAVIGDERTLNRSHLMSFPEVSDVMSVLAPYKLVARETKYENTIIKLPNGVKIGTKQIAMMSGPCAVESQEQLDKSAEIVAAAGTRILRGGAYKPRTSPYDFQGLGEEGLKMLRKTADRLNMAVVTEIMRVDLVETVAKYADILQVGTRNMQNFDLLKEVGQTKKPVMLKRGLSATLKEFLLAAEYIMKEGNSEVMMCVRGIRTFETSLRNTFDIDAIAFLKKETHLPIIADPSHATGKADIIPAMTYAAIAAGADGIITETHCNPEEALCDGAQALTDETYPMMIAQAEKIAEAMGRTL